MAIPHTALIAITDTTGHVHSMAYFDKDTSDAAIQATINKMLTKVQSWRRVKETDYPQDRTFRMAWRDTGKRIEPDMELAREIHRGRIRAARAVAFAELEGPLNTAIQQQDQTAITAAIAAIEPQRKVLRDAPADPRIANARTPDELKLAWPKGLRPISA